MVATLNANYMSTLVASGTFNVQSTGAVQGMFVDDPAIRFYLSGGVLATTETLPMWGGVGINVTVVPSTGVNPPDSTLGGLVTRATNVTAAAAGQLIGFSVFNQAYGMVITGNSPVPLAGSYQTVNYFPLGSGARIWVACASSLTSLEGGSIAANVSWDFVGQQLIPYVAAYTATSVSSATYTTSTGIVAMTFGSAPFGAGVGTTANGVYISVSGMTLATGSAVVNGDYPITGTASAGTVISVQGPIGSGATTINSSTGTLQAGGGACPVKVLNIEVANSMTVNFNSTTGIATWNYSGTCALVLLEGFAA